MTLFRRCGWLLAAFVLACSADSVVGPGGRFDFALARSVCGPADGPAIVIYLASDPIPTSGPSGEHVAVYIDGMADQLFGQRLTISSNSIVGASFRWTTDKFESATDGYVILNSGSVGNGLDGSLDLVFPSAGRVHGEFHSEWLPNTGLCT
jgi:hypothetical protein